MARDRHQRKPASLRALQATAAAVAMMAATSLGAAKAADFIVYKSPWCGCCAKWIDHLKANGHDVTVKETENLDPIKKIAGVPEPLQACHTAMVGSYVIEGHVPARDIERLLAEKPAAAGLSVPGMPAGSPGMEGGGNESYNVILFKEDGSARIYARY